MTVVNRTASPSYSQSPSQPQVPASPTKPPKPLIPGVDYSIPSYQCPQEAPEIVQFGDAFPAYLWTFILTSIVVYTLVPLFETSTPNLLNKSSSPLSSLFDLDFTHPNQFQGEYYHPYFAALLIFYYYFSLIARWLETDSHVFYEHSWARNYVMLASAYGMLTNSPLFTGISCVVVAVDQMCWYIDLAGFVIFRKYYVGVAKYLSNPATSFTKKLTAWHHLWFLPLMLSTLNWTLPPFSFLVGSIIASSMTLIARTAIPFYCLSLERTENGRNCHKVIYLNVNCPYAFWEDIPFAFLHLFNHSSPFLYIPYLYFIANIVLNLPAALILSTILMPFNGNYDLSTFS